MTTQQPSTDDSGFRTATTSPATVLPAVAWTTVNPTGTTEALRVAAVATNGNSTQPHLTTATNGAIQVFSGFDLSPTLATGEVVTGIRGLEVYLDDTWLTATCNPGPNRIQVQVSENAGAATPNWSGPVNDNQTNALTVGNPGIDTILGDPGRLQ